MIDGQQEVEAVRFAVFVVVSVAAVAAAKEFVVAVEVAVTGVAAAEPADSAAAVLLVVAGLCLMAVGIE